MHNSSLLSYRLPSPEKQHHQVFVQMFNTPRVCIFLLTSLLWSCNDDCPPSDTKTNHDIIINEYVCFNQSAFKMLKQRLKHPLPHLSYDITGERLCLTISALLLHNRQTDFNTHFTLRLVSCVEVRKHAGFELLFCSLFSHFA